MASEHDWYNGRQTAERADHPIVPRCFHRALVLVASGLLRRRARIHNLVDRCSVLARISDRLGQMVTLLHTSVPDLQPSCQRL